VIVVKIKVKIWSLFSKSTKIFPFIFGFEYRTFISLNEVYEYEKYDLWVFDDTYIIRIFLLFFAFDFMFIKKYEEEHEKEQIINVECTSEG